MHQRNHFLGATRYAICTHYNTVLENAQNRLERVSASISTNLSSSQAASHEQMMERTKSNLGRRKTQTAERTERKLAHQPITQAKATACTHTLSQTRHPGNGGNENHPQGPDLLPPQPSAETPEIAAEEKEGTN